MKPIVCRNVNIINYRSLKWDAEIVFTKRGMFMLFSRWTLFQGAVVIALLILSLTLDLFKEKISTLMSSSSVIPMLLTLVFITIVISLYSLFMIFQTKKSITFLLHPIWEKMHIIIFFTMVISIIVFIISFLLFPLDAVVQNSRWILYIIIYYFLFLINILVLSMVHKTIKRNTSNEKKIELSFVWTIFLLFVIIFLLPSI